MKILFKNKTTYTEQIYIDFLEFHNDKFGFKESFYTLFISMLILFGTILYLYNHYYLHSFFCFLVLLFFLYWKILRPISEVKQDFNSEKITEEKTFEFIFYDNYFKVSDNLQYSNLKYSKLYKVLENNEFIYLYLDNEHSLILNKNCFYYGESEDFSKFIKKKCWYKYKKYISLK